MCFDVKNECIRKKIQKCHMGDSFDQEHKRNFFGGIFLGFFFFKNTSNASLLEVFYR
jgi:hypothetical protein